MAMPLEDHVRMVLLENNRGQKFYEAVHAGWTAFGELYPQRHRWRRKSSARHMVWEEICDRLVAVAAHDPGIEAMEHQDTLSLIVDGEVLFRLKHADVSLLTRNYPTPEAVNFDNHDVDLFGFMGLQRVRMCYVLDRFETEMIWVGVQATSDGRFLWKIQLDGSGAVAVPHLPFPEFEADTARLARLKESKKDADKKKDDGQ